MTAPQDTVSYPLLPDSGADAFERELLARWDAEQLFEQAQAARAGATPDRKSTRLNSSHSAKSRMPSSA